MIRKIVFVLIILGLVTRAYLQKDVLFYDWDEGIYAEVSSSLIDHKSIQTRFNDEVWFNKPPLSHYLISTAFRLIPDPELAARLVMVILASLVLITLYQLTQNLMRFFFESEIKHLSVFEREMMFLLPVLVTASTPIFFERATQLNTDVMLSLFWILYLLYQDRFFVKLAAVTLGALTKSLLGLYPLGLDLITQIPPKFSIKKINRAVLLLIVPLLWHLINYFNYGDYFISSHLMDQLLKRVTDPIELHYGGRLYYIKLAWSHLHVFTLIMIAGYFYAFLDAIDFWKNRFNFKKYQKHAMEFFPSESWKMYVILFSAVPFFMFLSIVQSKISWYFATIVPLMTLSIPYFFMKLKTKLARMLMLGFVIAVFAWRFIPATYALQITSKNDPDNIKVALCIQPLSPQNVSMLVNAQERQNRNVLEAAQQQTETSFIYGGSPAFVYYTQKHVDYYYKVDEFIADGESHELAVVSQADIESSTDVAEIVINMKPVSECTAGEWRVFSR
jgi:4-amino-4-deoxy-L-arabinose transferase-like glycosyltransferase